MNKTSLSILAALTLANAAITQAADIYVSPTGDHTPPFANWDQAATNIGEAHRKDEEYEAAIAAYDRALEIRPDYLYALAGRAECMRMLADYEGSLEWFDRAFVVGPRHAFAMHVKAAAAHWSARNWLQRDTLPPFRL